MTYLSLISWCGINLRAIVDSEIQVHKKDEVYERIDNPFGQGVVG